MSDNLLNALMELVALFARVNNTRFIDNAHALLKTYLEQSVSRNNSRIHIRKFNDYFEFYSGELEQIPFDNSKVRLNIQEITRRLNSELSEEERMILFLSFLELIKLDNKIDNAELAFVDALAYELHINRNDYQNALLFILSESTDQIFNNDFLIISRKGNNDLDELEGTWIEQNRPAEVLNKAHCIQKNIEGELLIIKFYESQILAARYFGNQNFLVNNKKSAPDKFFIIKQYDHIRIGPDERLAFQELFSTYKDKGPHASLKFIGIKIATTRKKNNTGIAEFNFQEEPGNMVAIICHNSNECNEIGLILSGQLPIQSGNIILNGHNIFQERHSIHKMIGYVPSQPIYDENVSIYDNLFFSARLSFPNLSVLKIKELVDQVIDQFNLIEISKIPICKINHPFSADYLKLLFNTCLEIIRDPIVLILDISINGLNTGDADEFFNILKTDAAKGRITFIITTNPGVNFLKKTDQLWLIDAGGLIIYRGRTNEVLNYFKHVKTNLVMDNEICPVCGNLNQEELFQLIQAKVIDDKGKPSGIRRVNPLEWHHLYKEKIESVELPFESQKVIPSSSSSIPNIDIQFLEYLRIKIKSIKSCPLKQLLFVCFAPLLSLLISATLRNDWSNNYHFNSQENIPLLFFLNSLACLGIGIMSGIHGAQKEIKLIIQDHYRNYSFFSFLNAKLILSVVISFVISFLFTVVTQFISNIKGTFVSHWLVYFSIIIFGYLLGVFLGYLPIRAHYKFLIAGCVLLINGIFSGYLIPYSSVPKQISSDIYVPILADFVPTRWAFEALVVDQVVNNPYEKKLYKVEQNISDVVFKLNYLIPCLQERLNTVEKKLKNNFIKADLSIFYNELTEINKHYPDVFQFEFINDLKKSEIKAEILSELRDYLTYLQLQLYDKQKEYMDLKNKVKKQVPDSVGNNSVEKNIKSYYNPYLANYVINKNVSKKYTITDSHVVQLNDAIYRLPDNNFGRAHHFAPQKLLNGYYYQTLYFNVFMLWIEAFILYSMILIFHPKRIN